MRALTSVFYLSLFFGSCRSLPFARRGGAKENEKENEEEQAVHKMAESTIEATTGTIKIRGASIDSSSKNSSGSNSNNHNAIVESYFSNEPFPDPQLQKSNPTSLLLLSEIINLTTTSSTFSTFLTSTRRKLHKHPELMYQESQTSETIQSILDDLDIPFTTGWGKNTHRDAFPGTGGYGIVADIGSGGSPCIILRADIDALPITERTEGISSFKSVNKGKMHACGHDGHTTMLLGATKILKDIEGSLRGTVRLVFQPAEEGGAGAKRMVEEGVIDMEPRALAAYGIHVWPSLPSGTIASRPGPLLAAAEQFTVLISGRGGHAAMPHQTIDPIVTASSLILNLQPLISRNLSPLESGVVSVTSISSGDGAFNVIPTSALIKGTIRSLSTETLMNLRDKVEHVVNTTVKVYGCNATITYSPDFYPPTVNDPELFEFSKVVGSMVSDSGALIEDVKPTMGAEDFSFLAQTVPSTFFLLGQGSGGSSQEKEFGDSGHDFVPRTDYGLHHPHFALDEEVMPKGVALHVNLAVRTLKKLVDEDAEVFFDTKSS